MAPLLGRKPFSLVEPLAETPGPGEEVFIIEHTKEAFRNKEEYEARQQMYSAKIWTCKSTGSGQLTHKEAWEEEQEVTELLQEEYPAWFEKPVLEMVHHSTISLEKLVDQTWVEILTKYAVGEECDFWVGERSWRARVLKVHPLESPEEEAVKKLEGACDSPSSDKENATQEVQKEEPQPIEEENRGDGRCDRARRSPRTLPTSQKEQKKKCKIPKFLPHKYDILLLEQNKIVNDIAADSLYRTERPPNKEILRYFIRHCAMRLGAGDNAPWVVEDDLVKKYSLPSKLSDFVLEQYKNAGTLKRPPAGTGDARPTKMSRKSEGKKAEVFLLNTPREGGAASPVGTKPGETLPHIAKRLMRSYEKYKDNEDQKRTFFTLVTKASKVLSAEDRGELPEELQHLVQQRWEQLEHKRNLAALSEGERREVAARKRVELNEKRREKWRLARHEHQRRVEDQELEGRCLPDFKLVDMPEGLPNALFGDIAMVTDFFNSYSGLLMPNDQNPIAVTALMEALASEGAGFLYLNRVFVILLQTLLQDELAEGYSELGMALSEIPVSLHSVSELVRLSLRPSDVQVEESSRGSDEWAEGGCDDVVSASLLEKLETVELFELTPSEKVTLLVALCYRILMTYSVEDQLNRIHERIAQIWKDRADTVKAAHHRKMTEKRRQQELLGARGMSGCWVELGSRIEVSQFIRQMKNEDGAKKADEEAVPGKADSEDVIRAAKSRSLMSVPAHQNRARSETEVEDKWDRNDKASAEKMIQDGIDKLKLIMRRLPLGTDRFHNRYWLFSDQVPGLYIEKGWAHESIDYHYTLPSDEEDEEEEEEEESVKDAEVEEVPCGLEGAPAEAGHQRALLALENIETSVPKVGQNLWCVCDTTQQLEVLIESLHPLGVRECGLKARLRLRYQDIVDSIRLVQKPSLQLNTCDVHQEQLRFLRSDIMEMASRLQKGGLGHIDDLTELEERVHSLEKLKDLGECVIDLQARVTKKYLQGFMAPKQKKRRYGGEECSKQEEVDEVKRMAEEAKVATAVEKWRSAIREAQTFSRMHMLLGMLDVCVQWDRSSQNAHCKVCRKKGDDEETIILCDECNRAFHLFCLRPALYCIPQGDWQCPACQPVTGRRPLRVRRAVEYQDEEESSEEEYSSEDDPEEFNPYGHFVLRKRPKVKEASHHKRGKRASKRHRPPKPKDSRLRGSPSHPADIDELVRQSAGPAQRKLEVELAKCEEILQKLLKFRSSWPFREPLSPDGAKDCLPNHMDFQTMLTKFSGNQYRHAGDFLEDMRLVFSNAEEHNQPGSDVLACLAKTEQSFTDLLHRLLPGVSYVRRKLVKRAHQQREEPVDEEEEQAEQQVHRRRVGRPRKVEKKVEGEKGGGKVKPSRSADDQEEHEEEEEEGVEKSLSMTRHGIRDVSIRLQKIDREGDEEDDDQEEGKNGRKTKTSKRSVNATQQKNKRKQDEDEDGEEEDFEEEKSSRKTKRSKRNVGAKRQKDERKEDMDEDDEGEDEDDDDWEEKSGKKTKRRKSDVKITRQKNQRDKDEDEDDDDWEEEKSGKKTKRRKSGVNTTPQKNQRDKDEDEGEDEDDDDWEEEKSGKKTKRRKSGVNTTPQKNQRDKDEDEGEDEDDDDWEEEKSGKKTKRRKSGINTRPQKNQRDEDEEDDDSEEEKSGRGAKSSKRSVGTRRQKNKRKETDSIARGTKRVVVARSPRKDYRELDSEEEVSEEDGKSSHPQRSRRGHKARGRFGQQH